MTPIEFIKNIIYNGLEYFNKYYSEYRGFVVDNEDPKKQGRLRLVVPGIMDDPTDYWAPSSGTFSGKGFGSHVIPPVATCVWVSFENGDADKPVWRHGYFAKDHIPDELKDVNNYWFKTPRGHLIEMDDTEKEVRLTDSNGNVVVLTTEGVSIIPNGKIYLGSEDTAAEPGVMGDTLESLLKTHLNNTTRLTNELSTFAANVDNAMKLMAPPPTAVGVVAPLVAAINAQSAIITGQVAALTASANSLNESTMTLLNKLPKIKSDKVKLD